MISFLVASWKTLHRPLGEFELFRLVFDNNKNAEEPSHPDYVGDTMRANVPGVCAALMMFFLLLCHRK